MSGARTSVLWVAACLSLVTALAGIDRADSTSTDAAATQPVEEPQDLFKDRGLTHMGLWLILADETDLHNDVWDLKKARGRIGNGAAAKNMAESALQRGADQLASLQDQYKAANTKLAAAAVVRQHTSKNNPSEYDAAIEQYNDILGQVNSLAIDIQRQSAALQQLQSGEGDIGDSRSAYINLTIKLSARAEAIATAYAALTRDAQLKAAIAQYNHDTPSHSKLGPSGIFAADLAFVRLCARDVNNGVVTVATGEGGGPVVEALINGKVTDRMVWDSGATIVTISSATADKLGLTLNDDDPTSTFVGANGRKFKAKVVSLDSIRLGPFTAKNIQCAVLPPQFKGTDDLLGDSFQSRFICRLDQAAGQLQLTPVDPTVTMGAAPAAPKSAN